jgi:hypothetical protein
MEEKLIREGGRASEEKGNSKNGSVERVVEMLPESGNDEPSKL